MEGDDEIFYLDGRLSDGGLPFRGLDRRYAQIEIDSGDQFLKTAGNVGDKECFVGKVRSKSGENPFSGNRAARLLRWEVSRDTQRPCARRAVVD